MGDVVEAGPARVLGSTAPRVRIGGWPPSRRATDVRRFLVVDGEPAYELSFWCGTCQFLFRRVEGERGTLSVFELADRLAVGLEGVDGGLVERFGSLLPEGSYVPLLLSVRPRLVRPGAPGDYFAEEQVATWGDDRDPSVPLTPYYRTVDLAVGSRARLFEFVVPMLPPTWNDADAVARYAGLLAASDRPTAVAVATLDVCQPAVFGDGDGLEHWGLTHFLLDGHHKLQAAAETGRPLRLLSLLSADASLATPEQVARVPELRRG